MNEVCMIMYIKKSAKNSAIFNEKFENGAKECIVKISARALQRVFTCKIWLRYSRERAYLISFILIRPWSFNSSRALPPQGFFQHGLPPDTGEKTSSLAFREERKAERSLRR